MLRFAYDLGAARDWRGPGGRTWRGGRESKPAKAAQDIRLGGDVSELAAAYARGDPAS